MTGAPKLPGTDPESVLNVPLRRRELDYVLQVLALRPYGEVSELIDHIARNATPVIVPNGAKQ